MAEASLKRTASELGESASGSEDAEESSSALFSHPAKRRYIDESHTQDQPPPNPDSHTTATSPSTTTANGLHSHQQRQRHNGAASTTHASPMPGPSAYRLESPGGAEVPQALDEARLRGMESRDLIQTILELQSAYKHDIRLITAQYEDVSKQLADIRTCLSTIISGSAANLEAASQYIRASPVAPTTHSTVNLTPVTPLPAVQAQVHPTTRKPSDSRENPVQPASETIPTKPSPPVATALPLGTPWSASAQPTPSPSVESSFQRINTPARIPLKLIFPADGSVPTVVTYSTLHTVGEVWAEFKHGLDGMPPIEAIEQQWGSRWRPDPKGRTWFSRRKIVWDKVRELIHDGLTEEDAVAEVDAMRNGRSVHWLINLLTNDRKEIKASWKAAAAAAKAAKGKR